jgi:selenide, water dikinase
MDDSRKVTRFARSGGCAAKVGPGDLRTIMSGLARPPNADVLVGTETADDAGVYRISADEAIVCTADFITPLVDDPRLYGQIAAANAISDVYAMGGTPLAAIALCMFPKALEPDVAREILAGGQEKVVEAGAAVIGGHTVRCEELFYGLSVTGRVHPEKIVRNVGLRAGDALVLTKPLGAGLIVNGMRKGLLTVEEARPALNILATLNREASRVMREFGVHAATDVTGFGLSGHSLSMAIGSGGVGIVFERERLPLYPRVREMVDAGVTTGATKPNCENVKPRLRGDALPKFWDELVHDPQTSGGLLMAVDGDRAGALVEALHAAGVPHASLIGQAKASPEAYLELR